MLKEGGRSAQNRTEARLRARFGLPWTDRWGRHWDRDGELSYWAGCRLRKEMEAFDGDLLVIGRDAVQLRSASLTTDVAEFRAALEQAAAVLDPTTRAEILDAAVALYGGDLLPGSFEPWVVPSDCTCRRLSWVRCTSCRAPSSRHETWSGLCRWPGAPWRPIPSVKKRTTT